jgi:uncharacterized damage-inducible protein DinB
MTQQTATEKDMFLQSFERETAITLKLLRAFPADRAEYRPHEKSRSARELAWIFITEQGMAGKAIDGTLNFSGGGSPPQSAPTSLPEIITAFENAVRGTKDKVAQASESDLNKPAQFPIGPKQLGDFRRMDIVWMTLQDQIHHRGQLSVYLRLVGAKVPSIYGPTADENWM